MNYNVLLVTWGLLLLALAAIYAVRYRLSKQEDDHLHFSDAEQQMVAMQATYAHKLDVLDRWKLGLLILVILTGLLILGMHAYDVWQQGSRLVSG